MRTEDQRRAMFAHMNGMKSGAYRPMSHFAQAVTVEMEKPVSTSSVSFKSEPIAEEIKEVPSHIEAKISDIGIITRAGEDYVPKMELNQIATPEKVEIGGEQSISGNIPVVYEVPPYDKSEWQRFREGVDQAAKEGWKKGQQDYKGGKERFKRAWEDKKERFKVDVQEGAGGITRDISSGNILAEGATIGGRALGRGIETVGTIGEETGKLGWKGVKLGAKGAVAGAKVVGKTVGKTAQLAKGIVGGGLMVAAPAAAAFGATAGVGVTETLRETGNLITDPKREFYMPPGYQRVWTGEGDHYKMAKIDTPQLQPVHYNMQAGLAMPVGVSADKMDIADAAQGRMERRMLADIDDAERIGLKTMGTVDAGNAFERMRPVQENSPLMRAANLGYREAAEEFMRGRNKPKSNVGKSRKQMEVEAIMGMNIMDAARAFESGAKIVIETRPTVVQTAQRQYAPRPAMGAPIRRVSVNVPIASKSTAPVSSGGVQIPGAGGATNRYLQDAAAYKTAAASGDLGAADRAQARMQGRVAGLERSPTAQSKAILASIG